MGLDRRKQHAELLCLQPTRSIWHLGDSGSGKHPRRPLWRCDWTDSTGDLWLFGGYGYDSNRSAGVLDDLWEYQPAAPTAPIAQVTPNPLNFNPVAYGANEMLTLTIANVGGGTLSLTSVPTPNGPSYQVLGGCPAGIVAGSLASCKLSSIQSRSASISTA